MSKPSVTAREILNVLKTLQPFDSSKTLLKERSGVWQEAANRLDNRINVHNLYESVRQNRHNLLSELKSHFDIPEPDFIVRDSGDEMESDSCSCEESDDPDYEIEPRQNPHNFEEITFEVQLNQKEWESIRPDKIEYADKREYLMMKPHWTHLFSTKIHQEQKLTCCFAFRQKFYVSQEFPFFRVTGECSDAHCRNQIIGTCSRDFNVNSESVSITFETLDTRGKVGHRRKRKVAGVQRDELKKKLKYSKGACHRNEMGNLLEYSDMEPADLENSLKCRKIRQEAIDEALKMSGPTAIIDSLHHLKNNGFSEIQVITEQPFTVIFMTKEQARLWIELARMGKLKISIDASGGYVKIFKIGDRNTGHIFLYMIVTGYDDKIVPLWQMLSEAHNTNILKRALQQITKSGLPPPTEVVCDGSLALNNAVSLTWNKCSFKTYLNRGFRIAKDGEEARNGEEARDGEEAKDGEEELCPTYCREDRAHITKIATQWKPLKKLSEAAKDFYVRSVCYCFEIEECSKVRKVLLTLLVAANSTVHVPGSEFDSLLDDLMEKLKGNEKENHTSDDEETGEEPFSNSMEADVSEESVEYSEVVEGSIKEFLEEVYKEALQKSTKSQNTDDIPNEYYCPKIKTNLFYLFAQFVAWTNVIRKKYNASIVSTSCRSETMFKNLSVVSYLTFPVSANRFVLYTMQMVNGIIKLVKASMKNQNLLRALESHEIDEDEELSYTVGAEEAQEKENHPTPQGFQHHFISQQSRSNIDRLDERENHSISQEIQHHTNIQQIRRSNADTLSEVIFLMNGSSLGKMSLYGAERQYRNTCSYDSFMLLVSMGCIDFDNIRDYFSARRNCEFINCLLDFVQSDSYTMNDAYRDRNRLLHPFALTVTGAEVNCEMALPDLINNLLGHQDKMITERNVCSCRQVDEGLSNFCTLDSSTAEVILNNPETGLNHLQESVNVFFETSLTTCLLCENLKMSKKIMRAPILMIESQDLFLSQNLCIYSVPPQSLTVLEKNYELLGFVECNDSFIPLHYVAFYRRNERWLKVDDLQENVQEFANLPPNLKISVIFYVEKLP